jgi:hypothetical protein
VVAIRALLSSGAEPVPLVTALPSSWSSTLDDRPPTASAPPPPPRGLRTSIRSTRDAGLRLAIAHYDLAKAEASQIGGEAGKVAAYVGVAVVAVLFVAIFAVIGTSLFLGEWVLGSLGWGVLHGILLLTAIAIACALAAVGIRGRRILGALIVGAIIGLIVGILMALQLPNQAYTAIGQNVLPNVEPGVRPLVVGAAIWGIIGLIVGIIVAVRGRDGGLRVAALISAVLLGLIIGAISATTLGPQVGAGIGIAVGYAAWIFLMALDVSRTGIDIEAFKARFTPTQSIETGKETLAWLQSKMPPGIGS